MVPSLDSVSCVYKWFIVCVGRGVPQGWEPLGGILWTPYSTRGPWSVVVAVGVFAVLAIYDSVCVVVRHSVTSFGPGLPWTL